MAFFAAVLGLALVTAAAHAYCASMVCAAAPPALTLVENDDSEVAPAQVEKYVAVYKDMQRDRRLTVETAAAKEGLSVAEFRDLERRIGRNEALRQQVRRELQAAASRKP